MKPWNLSPWCPETPKDFKFSLSSRRAASDNTSLIATFSNSLSHCMFLNKLIDWTKLQFYEFIATTSAILLLTISRTDFRSLRDVVTRNKAVDKGVGQRGTPPLRNPSASAGICWTAAYSPAFPIISQTLPTFATHIFSWRCFHTNMLSWLITLRKRICMSARSVLWPKMCQNEFLASGGAHDVPQTP